MTPMKLGEWLERPLGRGAYAALGCALFALKHNLDRVVATAVLGRPWHLFNYLVPPERGLGLSALSEAETRFYLTFLWLALPFVAVGVLLTRARLRSAGWPQWLTVLFFLPAVNLVFFLVLSLVPAAAVPGEEGPPRSRFLDRVVPRDSLGSAALALAVTALVGTVSLLLGLRVFATYGWGVFVALPFALGLTAALIQGYHRPRGLGESLAVAAGSSLLLAIALLAVALEGLVCIVMAAPIFLALSLLGGLVGHALQRRRATVSHALLLAVAAASPLLMGAEGAAPGPGPLFAVVTSVEVDAPPERVWRQVIAFSELPPPGGLMFRAGVAYPVRATIEGEGIGAVRHCVFSTGPFVEPIDVWDAPRRLAFSVRAQPDPLQEWTPYRALRPAHLEYLRSERGEFLLNPLPGGRTHLQGTTWYRHRIEPAVYWRLFSDPIIHAIHTRVLRHVKARAEAVS
jgi:hypothetical protein